MGYIGTLEELKGRQNTATATTSTDRKELPALTQVMWHLKQNGMPFALWEALKRSTDISMAKMTARPYITDFRNDELYVLWCAVERFINSASVFPPLTEEDDENEIDPVTGKHKWFNPVRYPKPQPEDNKQ